MAWKVRLIAGAILTCLFVALYSQSHLPVPKGREHAGNSQSAIGDDGRRRRKNGDNHQDVLAVIVPFRNRFEELQTFAPYIHGFLNRQHIPHLIFIVNQVDKYRFNRAALINVGFKYAKNQSTYMVMHDVDLLPLNRNLSYKKPGKAHVMHVAAPGLHPKYDYPTFIGGILIISNEDFAKVNGMSNLYWGWGLEDDEFYVRLKNADMKVARPTVTTSKSNTFEHIHATRPRDMTKCFDQYNKTRKRDRMTGLRNVNYTLVSTTRIVIQDTPLTVLNVQLKCDFQMSPWCDCSKQRPNTTITAKT
ncbi:unnamed protein product [Allacma fusca]|uniref:Beta-1,4-N-acetylgalactosaminyltransferase n=1 Tax=Allacma fusca TaxID=39272 RepID=A0A8J2KSR0_9HEXA|nr:unnamed protein product [Allacma fusca]